MIFHKLNVVLYGLIFLIAGCFESPSTKEEPVETPDPREPVYDYYSLKISDQYHPMGIPVGTVAQNEISGLAWSRNCEDRIWAINDNDPFLFLLDSGTAEIVCVYHMENVSNTDWEAISIGKGIDELNTLYIADIGNNNLTRIKLGIYRISEPECQCDSVKTHRIKPDFDLLEFVYPDGSHDAEAIFVDDETLDIYIISKEKSRSGVYLFPYPQNCDDPDTLIYLGSLPFPFTVDVDYSIEEGILLLKTYDQIFLWEYATDKKIFDLIFDTPVNAPYNPIELQGESICISPDGYFTLSEKVFDIEPILYRYNRKLN